MDDPVDRELVAFTAQASYDSWEGGDGWGHCHDIALALVEKAGLFPADARFEIVDNDSDPPHSVLWVLLHGRAVEIDVDWTAYEKYEGGRWHRTPNAKITAKHVRVRYLAGPELEDFESLFNLE